ncbi:MAG: hypothetical protein ACOYNY_05555 [Caldilineaceae bacterium]
MASLLAVDLGLRAGLALYGDDGRLRGYRSQNFGAQSRLRRAAYGILLELPDLQWLVIEGGGTLAESWQKEAGRREVQVIQTSAETWRQQLLYPRQQRTGVEAKHHADRLARSIIDWSGAPRPTSLRHDAAEAILIGLWGVLQVGWLPAVPVANG